MLGSPRLATWRGLLDPRPADDAFLVNMHQRLAGQQGLLPITELASGKETDRAADTPIVDIGLSPDASQAYAKKGIISIGQIKISLGSTKSGLRVPLAITVSNRTELITATKLGAQIGLSYDFDSLFSK